MILAVLLGCNANCFAKPCGVVEGVVQMVAGRLPARGRSPVSPIANTPVTLRPAQGAKPASTITTAQDGRFRFDCVTPGPYVIDAAGEQRIVTVTPNSVAQVLLSRRLP